MKTIIELAREVNGIVHSDGNVFFTSPNHLERFAALVGAAQLERLLAGVEMPEPVAQLHPNHWKPNPDGSEWCREPLLYSPNNEGDKQGKVNTRVKLVPHDQLRETVAAAVAKKDAEISTMAAIRDEYQRVADSMAMSHKEERDTLKAENERLRAACRMQELHDFSQDLEKADAKTERLVECALRLVEHADFKLGGILSADSKSKDIPSNATSSVKSRHLAALRDALAAMKGQP